MGITSMALRWRTGVLAAWRDHVANCDIKRGAVKASRGLVILVTILVLRLAAVMILFMFATDEHL